MKDLHGAFFISAGVSALLCFAWVVIRYQQWRLAERFAVTEHSIQLTPCSKPPSPGHSSSEEQDNRKQQDKDLSRWLHGLTLPIRFATSFTILTVYMLSKSGCLFIMLATACVIVVTFVVVEIVNVNTDHTCKRQAPHKDVPSTNVYFNGTASPTTLLSTFIGQAGLVALLTYQIIMDDGHSLEFDDMDTEKWLYFVLAVFLQEGVTRANGLSLTVRTRQPQQLITIARACYVSTACAVAPIVLCCQIAAFGFAERRPACVPVAFLRLQIVLTFLRSCTCTIVDHVPKMYHRARLYPRFAEGAHHRTNLCKLSEETRGACPPSTKAP